MPCPYFFPVARMEEDLWAVPPRLPLGDAYTGECRSGPVPLKPEDNVIRCSCNSGYARVRCDRFPADASADAVRFNIAAEEGDSMRVQYVLEKNCWPVEYGEMRYSRSERSFAVFTAGDLLRRQAEAFLESYLRRAQ